MSVNVARAAENYLSQAQSGLTMSPNARLVPATLSDYSVERQGINEYQILPYVIELMSRALIDRSGNYHVPDKLADALNQTTAVLREQLPRTRGSISEAAKLALAPVIDKLGDKVLDILSDDRKFFLLGRKLSDLCSRLSFELAHKTESIVVLKQLKTLASQSGWPVEFKDLVNKLKQGGASPALTLVNQLDLISSFIRKLTGPHEASKPVKTSPVPKPKPVPKPAAKPASAPKSTQNKPAKKDDPPKEKEGLYLDNFGFDDQVFPVDERRLDGKPFNPDDYMD